jgi:PAS domain S-box-containing protein
VDADHAVYLLDASGRVTGFSPGAEKLEGWTPEEAMGRQFALSWPAESMAPDAVDRLFAQAAKRGEAEHEGWRVRKSSERYWAFTTLTALGDGAGQPLGFVATVRDLTDRYDTSERQRSNDQRLRLLIDSIRDYAVFTLDPEGHIASWNTGAQRIKQYTEKEIVGRHFSVFYSDEEIKAGKCEHELVVAAETGRFEEEGWRYRKDGSRFWASVTISAIRDASGQLIGYSKVTRDLSERRRSEDKLRLSEQRYRQLVDSIKDYAVFMLDPQGYVATWNVGAQRIEGYKEEEIVGKHFSIFYPLEDVRAGKCDNELAIATTTGRFEEEGWRLRKDGSRFWANVVINAVRNDHEHLLGFSKVTRDLTERRRVEEEQAGRIAAERANEAKDEFLALLGHELRNPLAPIVTALQLIEPRAEELGMREVSVIERQVKHMIRLVDDLLDVARLSRGKVELDLVALDLRDVVHRAVEVASPLLESRRHHLALQAPLAVPVFADEARLVQVFANLLTNAAKYTDVGGHITVMVRQEGEEAAVDVTDDGKGIAPDLLPRIFEPFVQGAQTSERQLGGLGIGLTLVRSLVGAHRGRVEVSSRGVGQGSTFSVRLPLHEAAAIATALPPQLSNRTSRRTSNPCRVLLVDDNEDARELSAMMLERAGHQVVAAGDGVEALERVKSFHPDVAVLDIGLPVMDGYELAVRLRAVLPERPPRLIALTGYGQPHDRERSSRAGFHLHLVKPIEAQELLASIDAVRVPVASARAPAARRRCRAPPCRRVAPGRRGGARGRRG